MPSHLTPTEQAGVPLGHYLDNHPTWRVELTCGECLKWRTISMGAVVDRLRARGLNARTIGIRELSQHVRWACVQCGGTTWETRPHRPTAD